MTPATAFAGSARNVGIEAANPSVVAHGTARMEVAGIAGVLTAVTIRDGAVSMRFVLDVSEVRFLFGELIGAACPVTECPHAVRKVA